MPDSKIRGVLFDKDGTLFDFQLTWGQFTETVLGELARDADELSRMCAALGYEPSPRRFVAGSPIVAGTMAEIAGILAGFRPDLGAGPIERRLDHSAQAILRDPACQFPAARDLAGLLSGLKEGGYALGVATHDSERAARIQLATAGLLPAFDFIAGYDSGHGHKPGPGMLLAFARAAGIAPATVAMVGDSRHDLEVARNAGAALAIAVLTGPATAEDLAPFADHILPSIEHLPALLAGTSVAEPAGRRLPGHP